MGRVLPLPLDENEGKPMAFMTIAKYMKCYDYFKSYISYSNLECLVQYIN